MARNVSIGLLILGAVVFFFFMPFGGEQKPATLHILFMEGFDNKEVEIKLDGNVIFKGKADFGSLMPPPPPIFYRTLIGRSHKAELVTRVSPFITEFSKFEVTMMESEVWVLISRGEKNMQKWTSFEFRYRKP